MSNLTAGSSVHGFDVVSTHELPEYRSIGRLLRHENTGAEVFHLFNDDPENLFSFGFRTLPEDSTGVAHILEHTVLCGSKSFPLKDPFLLLMKGSLQTFLNAMTFPDKTVYPASSTVEQDLFNIMRVYGDAVFFPLLRREMFFQEGIRLQFDDSDSLELTGVVFNEMQGAYSTHDSIAAEWSYRSLLPDTPYRHDSGGDPKEIRNLTYAEFKKFHETYYHPSNALVFLYGNIPTERYLEFLDREFFSQFTASDPVDTVPTQPRWSEPAEMRTTYPIKEGEETGRRSSVTVNWLLFPVTDPYRVLSLEVLTEILMGNSGSPLQKALVESGLGEDLSAPSGLETELMELVFSVGLRGTDAEAKADIETLIFDTLRALRDDGIDPEILEGALRKVEFRNREIRSGGPFGLRLMRRAMRGWLHGAGPVTTLEFSRWFEQLREDVHSDDRYFEKLIDEHLLKNEHRSTVVVEPDPEHDARIQNEMQDWIAEYERGLHDSDKAAIRERQGALKSLQEEPDPPEAVASIPFLRKSDLPTNVRVIPYQDRTIAGAVPLYSRDIFTNGIVYIDLAFDISALDASLMPYLPLYAYATTEVGLPGVSYDRVARQVSLSLGGLSAHIETSPDYRDPSTVYQHLFVRVKALESSLADGLSLANRILREADFRDEARMKDILNEVRNDARSSVIPGGHSYAMLRSGRGLSPAMRIDESLRGITQLLFLNQLATSASVSSVADRLEAIRDVVVDRSRLKINISAQGDAVETGAELLEGIAGAMPAGTAGAGGVRTSDGAGSAAGAEAAAADADIPRVESLIIPSAVGYVAVSLPGSEFGTTDYAAESVLSHLYKTGFLWQEIRMKGGAYGAFASSRGLDRVFTFGSYRDPNVLPTLDAYRRAVETFAEQRVGDSELELAIIGSSGRELRPYSPAEKSAVSFRRILYGISDEIRQTARNEMLGLSPGDVQNAARRLRDQLESRYTVVMAGREAVHEAAKTIPALTTHSLDVPI